MADTIPTHFSTEFQTNWTQRVQQTKARLDAFVEDVSFQGERMRFSRIGSQSSHLRTERKGPTNLQDPTTDARWAMRQSYDLGNLLDRDDAMNLAPLVLPTSDLVKSHANAYNRDKDDVAVKAALAGVYTGETGTTLTPFDTTNQWIGKGGVVGASTGTATGLTIGKLLTAREILNLNEVEDGAPIVLVCGPKEITNLLNTTKVTSADYASVKALANGTLDTFMGFKFVINNRLTVAASIRTCVAWVKGSIKRTLGSMSTDISIRKDLSMSTQIYSMWNLGATRVYDEGVVQIDCDESAAQPT